HFVIQRNPTAMPRAYVVRSARVLPEGERYSIEEFRLFDPRTTVLMREDPLRDVAPGRRQHFTPAQWTSTDPDHPKLEVTTSAPGLLVIADTCMPGWTARVDGVPAPIYRGNLAQRVVPLPQPGQHTICLDYWPAGLTAGGTITLATALGWLFVCGLLTCRHL